MKDLQESGQETVPRITLESIAGQSNDAARYANKSVNRIRKITSQMKMLALNAKIESAKAGRYGRGFAVVADEVGAVGEEISEIAQDIQTDLSRRLSGLNEMVAAMDRATTGQRLVDLAFTAVDTMDRNLYERTCDVRWWATDSSFVAALASPDAQIRRRASERLGVILDAYNIYLDLWICDNAGRIVANARPERFMVEGASVADLPWFAAARELASGDEYVAGSVVASKYLHDAHVISYAAAIRADGATTGPVLGVLATCFDWTAQARSVVTGLRIDPEMSRRGIRVLLVDKMNRVIAASDGQGILTERVVPPAGLDPKSGYYTTGRQMIGYYATDGFETYRGLGWKGVVVQNLD